MADVALVGARKDFGATPVLRGVDLQVEDGEFVVLVGPSGCGKSTLLRAVAGLEDLDSGDIRIGGRSVAGLPPAKRGIAMVFQSYALYPHMTLRENMAFGLKLAGEPREAIERAVAHAAELLDITHLLDRKPRALSGGQRQRVAIGRAIVREPDVFLFDEPLSNLDAGLRVKMRYEFARLHQRLKTTTLYVTHDQVEAMTLASRIAVMNGGVVEQFGTADELYRAPASRFVAGFIGSPRMNFLEGEIAAVAPARITVALAGDVRLAVAVDPGGARVGDPVAVGIRPEHFMPLVDGLAAEVSLVERLGNISFAYLATPVSPEPLVMQLQPGQNVREGERMTLGVRPDEAHLFAAEGAAFARPQSSAGNRAASPGM